MNRWDAVLPSEGLRAEAETRPGCVTSAAAPSAPTADRDAGGGGAAQPHERAPRRSGGRDYGVTVETQRAVMDDPRWPVLSLAQRLLLSVAITEWADVEGRWWTKRETWAARAGVNTKTLDAALATLRRLGLIESDRFFRPSRIGAIGGQSSNTYRLDPTLVRRVVTERQARIAERRNHSGSPIDGEADTVPHSLGRPGSPLTGEAEGKQLEEGVLEGFSSTKESTRASRERVEQVEEVEESNFSDTCEGCGTRSVVGPMFRNGYCGRCRGDVRY